MCNPSMTTTELPYFTFEGLTFEGTPVDIYDGDTFGFIFQWNGTQMKWRCRCIGYDSPEMKVPTSIQGAKREELKAKANAAKARLTELLSSGKVTIECGKFDKYGRILVDVYVNGIVHVNSVMMQEGHGYAYEGGTKMSPSDM